MAAHAATATRPRALVTGASSGIGLELARVLARAGHDLVLAARNASALDAIARDLAPTYHVSVHSVAVDLAHADGVAQLMDDIARAGLEADVLVNNAGFGGFGDFARTSLHDELRMIDLNIRALVALTKRCLPRMLERRRGRVLNVASTAAFLPGPHMAVYYATKAFVLSFSEAIRDELRDGGVTVTVLCPGPTETGFQSAARMQKSRLVQGAMMNAADVAEAGYRGLMAGRPVVIPGAANRMVPLLVRFLPRRLVTVVSRRAAESI
jgi:short-subunit dehydrogenase